MSGSPKVAATHGTLSILLADSSHEDRMLRLRSQRKCSRSPSRDEAHPRQERPPGADGLQCNSVRRCSLIIPDIGTPPARIGAISGLPARASVAATSEATIA